MAKTLGLSQIVKNEAHVITRMLDSVKDILDYITIVDTGSTDGTQDVIKSWATEHNIPCDIYERAFDNFANCRNYAMAMSKDKTDYSFWLDADEIMVLDDKFTKNLNKDIYMFSTHINSMKYTRNECWSNKMDFEWYGPVHEFIVPKDRTKQLTSDIMAGVNIMVHMDGGSWKEETASKYRTHAKMLEEYIDYTDRDPRWIFYTAQSYHDSSCIVNNEPENMERLRRSMKYYSERLAFSGGYAEERFYAQYRIGTILYRLQRPWEEVKEQLLKAYRMDHLRGEPFKLIIEHYQQIGDWAMAFLYSQFGYSKFHNKNPYPNRVLFVDSTLYEWKMLELYANSCFYMGFKDEGRIRHNELMGIVQKSPHLFSDDERQKLIANNRFFNNMPPMQQQAPPAEVEDFKKTTDIV